MKTFPICSAAKNEVRHGISLTLYLYINLKTPTKPGCAELMILKRAHMKWTKKHTINTRP